MDDWFCQIRNTSRWKRGLKTLHESGFVICRSKLVSYHFRWQSFGYCPNKNNLPISLFGTRTFLPATQICRRSTFSLLSDCNMRDDHCVINSVRHRAWYVLQRAAWSHPWNNGKSALHVEQSSICNLCVYCRITLRQSWTWLPFHNGLPFRFRRFNFLLCLDMQWKIDKYLTNYLSVLI